MIPEQHKKIYSVFINWYAMPPDIRQPKTVDEFCQQYKIPHSLLAEFQNYESYTDDIYKASIRWGKSKVPELLHMLYSQYLLSKKPNDLKMYKELLNMDKTDRKGDSPEESDRKGLLRELFEASK